MILLPRAADELEIPFVLQAGLADARSLVAAMALGAKMNMGTRFIVPRKRRCTRTSNRPRCCLPSWIPGWSCVRCEHRTGAE